MPIVAVTGGIAAGKSTVSDRLALHGALVIDADQLARDVVEPGSATLREIVTQFGPGVCHPDGSLNRAALGAIVFEDHAARARLNAIVHPAVKTLSETLFRKAQTEEPDRVVVYAVPLIAESGRRDEFDLVVVVHAPRAIRIRRLVAHRGMTEAEATNRVDAQASDEERLAIADVILDASGTLEQTVASADQLSEWLWRCWPDQLALVPPRFPSADS
jgi:dephospho-CoA kinase